MSCRLVSPAAELVVDPSDGARWTSLTVAGLELLGGADIPGAWPAMLRGCFVMAPYAGRVGGAVLDLHGRRHALPAHAPPHAIHGTVLTRTWTVEQHTGDLLLLTTGLGPDWPFPGRVVQRLTLDEDQLTAQVRVEAEGAMPVTVGLHPWFRRRLERGGELAVGLSGGRRYRRGPDGLPTGELVAPGPGPWDDCFTGLAGPPVLTWPGALSLTLDQDHDHWVVFDERPETVCVEPQTGPPDAVRLGRSTWLPAGGDLTMTCTMTWRLL